MEWDAKRWPRVYLARHVLDAILHPLEDLRSMPGTAAKGAVLKSGAAAQQAPLRRADRLMAEAMAIIDAARERGAQLRLTGGLAIRRYCTDLDVHGPRVLRHRLHRALVPEQASSTRCSPPSATPRIATSRRPPTRGQLQYIKIEALDEERAQAKAVGEPARRTSRRSSTTSTSSST